MRGLVKCRPRVSLRWIVGMLFVVSILAVWSRSAARQRHAVAVLKRAGAQVKYDSDLASAESIVARWSSGFAPNYLSYVTNVIAVESKDVPSQDLIDALLDCPRLKSLGITRDDIRDSDLIRLAQHDDLERIAIQPARLISDASLSHLADLPRLRSLELFGGHYSANGIASVAASTSLKKLYLSEVDISGDTLSMLSRMTDLTTLSIGTSRRLTDDDLEFFKPLENLELLILHRTQVSKRAWDELQRARPRCNMSYLDNIEPTN